MTQSWTRKETLARVTGGDQDQRDQVWDVVIIGGGATGLGVALDSASRGYKTLLLERYDFTQGTSSRSTKLVHGGVRYLRQGQVSLVFEALHERGRLRKNAPHLVRVLPFVITARNLWQRWFYRIGLTLYDLLAGRLRFGRSESLSREGLRDAASTLKHDNLRGGVLFYDGQMDDARLGLALAKTATREGATTLNYCEVISLHRDERDRVNALTFRDHLAAEGAPREHRVKAHVVINATGVFTDGVRALERSGLKALVRPSQGAHVVLPKRYLPESSGVVFPETPDGRVLFAVPWYDRALIGTTDVYRGEVEDEPAPLEEEIEFIMEQARAHFAEPPQESEILSVFAGLRPLVAPPQAGDRATSKISREHNITIGSGGVFHITGGKWTTYRRMAEDLIEAVIEEGALPKRPCVTAELRLVGWSETEGTLDVESVYGAEREQLLALERERPELGEALHPALPYRSSHVVFAARQELAATLTDVLSRRTRSLLLDARASIEVAPRVAELLARELGHSDEWVTREVEEFTALAERHLWPVSTSSVTGSPRAETSGGERR